MIHSGHLLLLITITILWPIHVAIGGTKLEKLTMWNNKWSLSLEVSGFMVSCMTGWMPVLSTTFALSCGSFMWPSEEQSAAQFLGKTENVEDKDKWGHSA